MGISLAATFGINAALTAATNFALGAATGYTGISPTAAAFIFAGGKGFSDQINLSEPLRSSMPARVGLPVVAAACGVAGNICSQFLR